MLQWCSGIRLFKVPPLPPVCLEDLTRPLFAVGVAAGAFFLAKKNVKIENNKEDQVIKSLFVEIRQICDL